ncbi:hypothetical protein COF68_05405 [Bacillus toyonensis]|uniref:hypothetical protein n=1 Tax=Bacillus toyonensis TaxID=155322 RepID=UPI000BFD6466|nr:hypothetical protein [Bacillus toyonensis]PHE64280.1 hypothetical protein COF68_05405 [Bacillus toyonensis]
MDLKVLYGGLTRELAKVIEKCIEDSPKSLVGSSLGSKVVKTALKRQLRDSTVSIVLLNPKDFSNYKASLSDDRLVSVETDEQVVAIFQEKFGLVVGEPLVEEETPITVQEEEETLVPLEEVAIPEQENIVLEDEPLLPTPIPLEKPVVVEETTPTEEEDEEWASILKRYANGNTTYDDTEEDDSKVEVLQGFESADTLFPTPQPIMEDSHSVVEHQPVASAVGVLVEEPVSSKVIEDLKSEFKMKENGLRRVITGLQEQLAEANNSLTNAIDIQEYFDLKKTRDAIEVQLNKKIKDLENEVTSLNNELDRRTADNGKVIKRAMNLEKDLKSEKIKSNELGSELADLKPKYAEVVERNNTQKDKIYDLSTENISLRDSKETLERDKRNLEVDNRELTREKKELEESNRTLVSEKRTLTSEKADLLLEKQTLESDKLALESDKRALESETRTLESENRSLESEKRNLEVSNRTMKESMETLEKDKKELIQDNKILATELRTSRHEQATNVQEQATSNDKTQMLSGVETIKGKYPNVTFIVPLSSNSVLKMYEYISTLTEDVLFIDLTNNSYIDSYVLKLTSIVRPTKWLEDGVPYNKVIAKSQLKPNLKIVTHVIHKMPTDLITSLDWDKVLKEVSRERKVIVNIGAITDNGVLEVLKAVQRGVVLQGFVGNLQRDQRMAQFHLKDINIKKVLGQTGIEDKFKVITERW